MKIEIIGGELGDRLEEVNFSGYDISGTTFNGAYIAKSNQENVMSSIKDVDLRNVSHINCDICTTAIEDVSIHNLKRMGSDPLFLWCCVFKHVKLSGRISGLKINRWSSIHSLKEPDSQKPWDDFALDYYKSVDWALDISEAKFGGGVSFEAIPGDKIIRDPSTQAIIYRSALMKSDWEQFDYGNSAIDIELSNFLLYSLFDSVVIAARLGSKDAKRDVQVINRLKEAGIAE